MKLTFPRSVSAVQVSSLNICIMAPEPAYTVRMYGRYLHILCSEYRLLGIFYAVPSQILVLPATYTDKVIL